MRQAVKDLLQELPKTSHGKALKEFLDEEIKEIDSVSGILTLEDAKGKQIALKTLRKIFVFLEEKPVAPKPKGQYT